MPVLYPTWWRIPWNHCLPACAMHPSWVEHSQQFSMYTDWAAALYPISSQPSAQSRTGKNCPCIKLWSRDLPVCQFPDSVFPTQTGHAGRITPCLIVYPIGSSYTHATTVCLAAALALGFYLPNTHPMNTVFYPALVDTYLVVNPLTCLPSPIPTGDAVPCTPMVGRWGLFCTTFHATTIPSSSCHMPMWWWSGGGRPVGLEPACLETSGLIYANLESSGRPSGGGRKKENFACIQFWRMPMAFCY